MDIRVLQQLAQAAADDDWRNEGICRQVSLREVIVVSSFIRKAVLLVCLAMLALLTGCGNQAMNANGEPVRVIRIGHNQAENHPTHIALEAFKEHIEQKLGNKYKVEIYPNELLGSQLNMVQLTQTGAIDICIASNAILGSFSKEYDIFNLPYLFASPQAYAAAMNDRSVTGTIFRSTTESGFTAVTWLDAGTRNFYAVDKPINSPADLAGMKVRVQPSKINVQMMDLLGGSATPMGFGDVYTALQSKIIDGAENNELALTNNGHGDVCKYYSYDMHQMIPDIVIANNRFLDEITDAGDRAVFEEGFALINQIECEKWQGAVAEAKRKAQDEQGVIFNYPDQKPFVEATAPLTQLLLSENPSLREIYERIQTYNSEYPAASGQGE